MLRRPTPLLTALGAAMALAVTTRPSPCPAAGITSPQTYRLSNDTGSKAIDHVFIGFDPKGAIIEPSAGKSPLKIVDSSPGLDRSQVDVGIFDFQPNAGAPPQQALGLDFQGTGFGFLNGQPAPAGTSGGLGVGQSLTFTLNVDPTLADQLQLQLLDPLPSTGLTLKSFATSSTPDPGSGPTTPPDGGTTAIPEPLSVLVWTTLAGLGLLRTRLGRRPLRAAA